MRTWISLILALTTTSIFASEFPLPPKGHDIVGQIQTAAVQPGDTFASIAQKYNVTYAGMVEANPGIDAAKPTPGTVLVIPSQYVLPDVARKGIVINLAELRLYYYPKNENVVYTYPIGIGVEGWNVQPGPAKIVQKQKDPTWYPTPDVRAELKAKGFDIPAYIKAGPDNPLGGYMLRLSHWTYLIHGCVDPTTIGRRSSSGCFRMYPEDIQTVFNMVPVGTPVNIINEPYKIGWQDNQLYMEAHLPLQESQAVSNGDMSDVVSAINTKVGKKPANIQWDHAFTLAKQTTGVPEVIGGTL